MGQLRTHIEHRGSVTNDHSSPAVYHKQSLDWGCAVNGDADDCTKRRKELSESGDGHRQVMKKSGWSSSKKASQAGDFTVP